jgi:hypothetical protein
MKIISHIYIFIYSTLYFIINEDVYTNNEKIAHLSIYYNSTKLNIRILYFQLIF